MIDIADVKKLSDHQRLLEFADFVISKCDGAALPDYTRMDLMEIHRVVPHIFVFDVLKSTDHLVMKYCGTVIDQFYGTNMVGRAPYAMFEGKGEYTQVEHNYWHAIKSRNVAYARRSVHYANSVSEKYKIAESMLFPCSSDGETVNYALGFADYYPVKGPIKRLVTQIARG